MKEYEHTKRIGTEAHRSYYIPFSEADTVRKCYGIIDRESSARYKSLNGKWFIKEHSGLADVEIDEEIIEEIIVPSCVQMQGYDQIQYLNYKYPFLFDPPYVPKENPCWH